MKRDEPPAVAVYGNLLIEAFFTGTRRFQEAIAADPNKSTLVKERANILLAHSPPLVKRGGLLMTDATWRKLQRFLREQSSDLDKN